MHSWLRLGKGLGVASLILLVIMQAVAGQWFPPPVSISQYGVGRWGWIFSLWVLAFSLAPICFERAMVRRTRLSPPLLYLGLLGTVVMAVVRTDAGGAQLSLNAKVHMVASIFCLAFLPLGMLAALWVQGRGWRWLGIAEAAFVAVSMTLLVMAATGIDTAGMGSHRSWAFWQAVAVVGCLVMVATMGAAADRAVLRSMRDHTVRAGLSARSDS